MWPETSAGRNESSAAPSASSTAARGAGERAASFVEEFEEFKTPESKYANALDRLQPLLHNARTEAAPGEFIPWARDQVTGAWSPSALRCRKSGRW